MTDGLIPPQNAPPPQALVPGVQPGVSGGVVLATLVVIYNPAGGISGILIYSPAPGTGNLVGSWSAAAGVDQYGNTYGQDINIGPNSGPQISIARTGIGGQSAAVQFLLNTLDSIITPLLIGQVVNPGAANQFLQLLLQGPAGTGGNSNQYNIIFNSDSDDSTIPAEMIIYDRAQNPYLAMTNTGTPAMYIGVTPGGTSTFLPVTLNGVILAYGQAGIQVTQTYTSQAQSPVVIPAGVTAARFQLWAPGAGGRWASGPGGGSGEYAEEPAAVVHGGSYPFTMGTAGTRGTSGNPNGTGGGNVTITLDAVTVTAHGAPAISSSTSTGGTGSANTVHHDGAGCTSTVHTTWGGGGGAGSPSPAANGQAGSGTTSNVPGAAGSGPQTGGGGGGWGSTSSDSAATGGGNGGTPGAGGGAGGAGPSGGGATGGNGGGPTMKVTYTLPGTETIIASMASAAGADSGGRSFPAGFGGINIPIVTQVPATQAFTLASPVLITGLSEALVPGTYDVVLDLFWVPSGTIGSTHQHYIAFSGTASASAWDTIIYQAEAANAVNQTSGYQTGSAFPIASVGSPTHVAFNGWTTVRGQITVTAAGTLAAGIVLATAGDGITTQLASRMQVTRTA